MEGEEIYHIDPIERQSLEDFLHERGYLTESHSLSPDTPMEVVYEAACNSDLWDDDGELSRPVAGELFFLLLNMPEYCQEPHLASPHQLVQFTCDFKDGINMALYNDPNPVHPFFMVENWDEDLLNEVMDIMEWPLDDENLQWVMSDQKPLVMSHYLARWRAAGNLDWLTAPDILNLRSTSRYNCDELDLWYHDELMRDDLPDPFGCLMFLINAYHRIDWVHEFLDLYPDLRGAIRGERYSAALGYTLASWDWDFVMEMLPLLGNPGERLEIDVNVVDYWIESKHVSGIDVIGRVDLEADERYYSLEPFQITDALHCCLVEHYPAQNRTDFTTWLAEKYPDKLVWYLMRLISSADSEDTDKLLNLCQKHYPDITVQQLFHPDTAYMQRERAGRNYPYGLAMNRVNELFVGRSSVRIFYRSVIIVIIGEYEQIPGFQQYVEGVQYLVNNGRLLDMKIIEEFVDGALTCYLEEFPRAKRAC